MTAPTFSAGEGRRPGREAAALPLVSVVIPSVRPHLVPDALKSVADQIWPGPVEAVVVHDGGPSIPTGRWPFFVRSLGTPVRGGPARARNVAARHAWGQVLAFLDDDDVWLPTHLAEAVPSVLESGGLAFTHALVEHVDEGWTAPLRTGYRAGVLRRTNPAILSTMVVSRDAFLALHGFADDLTRYEDWDFLLRAEAAGVKIAEIPVITARYRFSGQSMSAGAAEMAAAFQRFAARHGLTDVPRTNFARMAQASGAASW
jgi:glycosyltransferase involved in cell wall biosynthesis